MQFFAAGKAVSGARQIAELITLQFLVKMHTGQGGLSQFPLQLEFNRLGVGHGRLLRSHSLNRTATRDTPGTSIETEVSPPLTRS